MRSALGEDDLIRMTDAIRHRGPDGEGQDIFNLGEWQFALGHRRLAIIDPVGSRQPMSSADGRYSITFNGEIYNYRQLRAELIELGWQFRTQGDTEVLLTAYAQWGAEAVSKLDGMFAFAIFDALKGSIFLARDAFGEKPLFITEYRGGVAFASEIKALLQLPGMVARLDSEGLALHEIYRYTPGPRTLFSGVRKLQAGTYGFIENGVLSVSTYFRTPDARPQRTRTLTDGAAVEEFRGLLSTSVRMRMMSDVPFGAFLSGGIDSSTIVALMQRESSTPIKTFSVGFTDVSNDELPYADMVAKAVGTDHHPVRISASDIIDDLPKITIFREAPISETADIAIFRMSIVAKQHVSMVLSGEGADETLGGYPKHSAERYVNLYQSVMPGGAHRVFEGALDRLPFAFSRLRIAFSAMGERDEDERMANWFGAFSAEERKRLFGNGMAAPAGLAATSGVSALRRALVFDQEVWLPDNLLERGDRMTMAASVESRVPFLSVALVQFLSELGDRMRIRGLTSKWILRQVAKGLVPDRIIKRPKVAFKIPVSEWFKTSLRSMLGDRLLGPGSHISMLVSRKEIERVLVDHWSGKRDYGKLIWWLLTLEIFLSEYHFTDFV
jgi:asparagine synthase (glutamine-hydrolysing)